MMRWKRKNKQKDEKWKRKSDGSAQHKGSVCASHTTISGSIPSTSWKNDPNKKNM